MVTEWSVWNFKMATRNLTVSYLKTGERQNAHETQQRLNDINGTELQEEGHRNAETGVG